MAGKGAPGRDVVRVPEADRREAYEQILTFCKEHFALLVLVKPIYAKARYADDPLIDSFARRWDNIVFVDLPRLKAEQALSDEGLFQPDDTHPTPAGHRWIATQIAAAMDLRASRKDE
jgi:lysophospholipase L1-like esterase